MTNNDAMDATSESYDLSLMIEEGLCEWRATTMSADGFPADIAFISDESLSAVDVIYRARVRDVNKALDMAFLDLGAGRDGVLSFRRAKQIVKGSPAGIADCLREGERLMVQGLADPSALENKAVQVTAKPRLVGRYVVLEQAVPRLFFSKDLPPRTVKTLIPELTELAEKHSIIVRTAAIDQDPKAVQAEAEWLASAFENKSDKIGPLFSYSPLEQALMKAPDGAGAIYIENGSTLATAKQLCGQRWPDLLPRLTLFEDDEGKQTMADYFAIDEAVDEALAERIDLPCGGWIAIEETKALTVVDVNVGSALQGRSAAEALLTVNIEAALATLYHLRFQDIGGLVVIDFVDMSAKGSAAHLVQVVDDALKDDPVPVRRSGLSQFGLMELARRRKGLSMKQRFEKSRTPVMAPRAMALKTLNSALKVGLGSGSGSLHISLPKGAHGFLEAHQNLIQRLRDKSHRDVKLVLGDKPFVQLK